MNVLHYFLGFPSFNNGGLMVYARDLAKQQLKSELTVIMLMPGKYRDNSKKSVVKYYKTIEQLPIYQIVNGLPFSDIGINNPRKFIRKVPNNNYKNFLLERKIEALHIHSLIGLPKEFIDTAKELNIRILFTTHDYFGLCPKISLFNYNNEQCYDYKNGLECVRCNLYCNENKAIGRRNRNFKIIVKLLKYFYRINFIKNTFQTIRRKTRERRNSNISIGMQGNISDMKDNINCIQSINYVRLREYYLNIIEKIDVLLFNSFVTKNEYSRYINLDMKEYYIQHVTHEKIEDMRTKIVHQEVKSDKVHFLYMGYLDRRKGFFDLVGVLEKVKRDYNNWDISIYGDLSMINIAEYSSEYYHFKGRYDYEELPKIFAKADILVIPSKWKETFGFIGLEALSHGVPVLASDNVGFSDLIDSGINGLVYNDDKDNQNLYTSIVGLLNNSSILKSYRENLASEDFNYGMSEHSNIICKIYMGEY